MSAYQNITACLRASGLHPPIGKSLHGPFSPLNQINQFLPVTIIPRRNKYYNNRHVIEKWKRHRARKVIKVELPDFEKFRKEKEDMHPEEIRSKMKEKGIAPPRHWSERELFMPCTSASVDPYRPPEGEGKTSLIDAPKKLVQFPKDKIKEFKHKSKIRSFEPEFNFDLFAENDAPEIYINAHNTLAAHEYDKMFEYVTERCYPLMTEGLRYHTIHWKFMGNVETPRYVQVRYGDMMTQNNTYGQITVRFFTKQILAIYDRHGRLLHGSESDVKEVLEYIVFEKHLVNEYSKWRIHERLRPNDPVQSLSKTYEVETPKEVEKNVNEKALKQ